MHPTIYTQQIRQFILENFFLGQEENRLEDTDSFLEQGILDSTGVLQLITFLEETFGLGIKDEEVSPDNLDSVEKVAAFISRKLATEGENACAVAGTTVETGV